MSTGRTTTIALTFREAKKEAQKMSESTSGERLFARVQPGIAAAEGKITIFIDADELHDQDKAAEIALGVEQIVEDRTGDGRETDIVAVVQSIVHASGPIVANAEQIAIRSGRTTDADLIDIVDRCIAGNRGTERLLYRWKHRYTSEQWLGHIDFRAADQPTGVDFIAISHEESPTRTEFIRIACDRIAGYAPFATTARVTKEWVLAREQSQRFADRWLSAKTSPPAIHHPDLAAEMIRVYREGVTDIEKLAHREIEILPTILQQINEIY